MSETNSYIDNYLNNTFMMSSYFSSVVFMVYLTKEYIKLGII